MTAEIRTQRFAVRRLARSPARRFALSVTPLVKWWQVRPI